MCATEVSKTPTGVTKASKKEAPAGVLKKSACTVEATAKVEGDHLGAPAKPVTEAAPVVTPAEKTLNRRLNMRIPGTVYRDLEVRAEKEGLTVTAWVSILLASANELEKEMSTQEEELRSTRVRLAEAEKAIAGLKSQAASGEKSAGELSRLRNNHNRFVKALGIINREIGSGTFSCKCNCEPNCRSHMTIEFKESVAALHSLGFKEPGESRKL